MVPHADNNVYLYTTTRRRPCNKGRVLEFLRTTFFDNAAALECQLAANMLDVVRHELRRRRPELEHLPHRETVRWHSRFRGHECVPVLKDELRKQADTFTGKVNIWGDTYSPPRT